MKFKIFSAEFEADMLDYDYMTMVEKELKAVHEKTIAVKKEVRLNKLSHSELVKKSTEVIRNFFDTVFGEGAAQKILGDKIHYGLALEAFSEYILQKNIHSGDDIKAINDKYLPEIEASIKFDEDDEDVEGGGKVKPANSQQYNGNRAQRRNAQKNNKKGKNPNKKYHK